MTIQTQVQPEKWWGAGEPIYVGNVPRNGTNSLGHVRHIRFSNLLCTGENGVYLRGCAQQPLEDIVFDNVRIEVGKTGAVRGGFYDDRPMGGASASGNFAGLYTNTIAGIHVDYTRGLVLRNTRKCHLGRE